MKTLDNILGKIIFIISSIFCTIVTLLVPVGGIITLIILLESLGLNVFSYQYKYPNIYFIRCMVIVFLQVIISWNILTRVFL